jgi:hypothetical protein
MKSNEMFINAVILSIFLVLGVWLFADFVPQQRPLPITGLFYTPIPLLVAILIYLTVMGTRKVMDDKKGGAK